MEAQGKQDIFRLNRGLNTDSHELNFLDGYTVDELNYELLVDGSRRRRKGLGQESGGATLTMTAGQSILTGGVAHDAYVWNNVGGDPSVSFVVAQIDHELYFLADSETPSSDIASETIDLADTTIDGSTAAGAVGQIPAQFSQGRGVLLVTHPKCYPMYVSYDADADTFSSTVVNVRIRDFYGIDDGTQNQYLPATLTADHTYNLRNRGWITADITAYQASQAAYPSKSQFWYSGYRRQTSATYQDADGIQAFDPAKLAAEEFGTSSAPQGSLLLNPLDTTYSASPSNDTDSFPEVQITDTNFTVGNPKAGGTLNVTAVAHGRTTGNVVTINGHLVLTRKSGGAGFGSFTSYDGSYSIIRIDNDNFTITIPPNTGKNTVFAENSNGAKYGQVNGNVALPKSDGVTLSNSFRATAYHAGRAFFAGIEASTYNDTIFFSKVALEASAFGVCHQEADPTNPEYNLLQSNDGGTIVIPNLGRVQRMLSFRDVLLVFTNKGVWEVGGGRRGLFTADGYSVRKITEAECSSSRGVVAIGNRAIYTGPRGIHILAPNQYTGLLEETSLTENLIQTFWNTIPAAEQQKIKSVYDDALDRVYFFYDDGTATDDFHYQFSLILDLRIGAFYKYRYAEQNDAGVCTAFAITEADSSNSNKKIKFLFQNDSTTQYIVCDLDQTDFLDPLGTDTASPYFVTGWHSLGDTQRRGQAPIITVYAKRTETGYTATGNGYDPVNESSTRLTALWDWTDGTQWTDINQTAQYTFSVDRAQATYPPVSGKTSKPIETYRHPRSFTPASTTTLDGYPIVTTRNKLRGRGRVLQLRFDGDVAKDSHVLGFTINTKSTRRK